MNDDSPDLKTAILERIRADAPRKVWTPADFVDLASRDAVDKTLQRLTNAKNLRRIDRGLYDQLGFNKLTQKPRTRPIRAPSSTPLDGATRPGCSSTA
jgi:Family of unknown function (DUF6088)